MKTYRLSFLLPPVGRADRDAFIKVHLALGLNRRSPDIPYAHKDPVIAVPQELDISGDKYSEIQVNQMITQSV